MAKAKDGVITISFTGERFLGATAPGEYPPAGEKYENFSCKPQKGESGSLIFEWASYPHAQGYAVYQFHWQDGKVQVERTLKKLTPGLQFSSNYEFFVQLGDVIYCSKAFAGSKLPYRKVGIIDIFLYAEGKIGTEELESGAQELQAAAEQERLLETQLGEARQMLDSVRRTAGLELEELGLELSKAKRQGADYHNRMTEYGTTLYMVPKWVASLVRWWNGSKLPAEVERLYATGSVNT